MAEKCPLGSGLRWNCEGQIPQFCLEHCESIWEEATRGVENVDMFAPDCDHDVEYGDDAIQRLGEGSLRLYSVLNICMWGCGEAFAQEWEFTCPRD